MTSPREILALVGSCICGDIDCLIPFGECHCGCGRKTTIANRTKLSEHVIRGLPIRFIKTHTIRFARRGERAVPFKVDGIYCRTVSLGRGYHAIVYASRYEFMCKFRWKAIRLKTNVYATAKYTDVATMKSRHIMMHNLILFPNLLTEGIPHGFLGDHRSGIGLDNRDSNLRIATYRQNTQNMRIGKQNTSGYKGVTWNKREQVWLGHIWINGKLTVIYRGQDKVEAAHAYDNAARLHFGEFACVNFPRPGERSAI